METGKTTRKVYFQAPLLTGLFFFLMLPHRKGNHMSNTETKENVTVKAVTKPQRKFSTRVMVGAGMLAAVSIVLQYLEFPIFIMPFFIKMDFSDLPALIGAFAYGPLVGVVIQFVKNLVHLLASQSAFVGELSNFILGAVFVATAGLVYKKDKTKKHAFKGGLIGAVVMGIASIISNYFLVYPVYYRLYMPEEVVLGAYQAILPSMKNIIECLLVFNLPFTIVKGLLCVVIAMLIYKPLSRILKG